MEKRFPSPEIIRASMSDLRSGKLTETEHETRTEILELALARIQEALPESLRKILGEYPPQLLEAWALLAHWQGERATYPQAREDADIDQFLQGQKEKRQQEETSLPASAPGTNRSGGATES